MSTTQTCLDNILTEIGDFGKYQRRVSFFIVVATIWSYFPFVVWVFESKQLNYRCEITGCETYPIQYKPSWWTDAIPSVNNEPSQCERYKFSNNSDGLESCTFNRTIVEHCNEYIYETTKTSILRDFNLQCNENRWKLTLVGTITGVGLLVGLPIGGVLSDKFGRKTILISSVVLSCCCGLIRSFSTSYIFFIIMQFMDSLCSAITYPTCIIIGIELVSPKQRPLISVLISVSCGVSGMLVGGLAWIVVSWRTLDRILYGIPLIILSYYWLIPESIRWLLANKKLKDVQKILETVSKANKKTLSEESLQKLWKSNISTDINTSSTIIELLKSFTLIKRLIYCCICWICCVFTLQGLTINSVNLSHNSYLNFILTMAAEVPGTIIAYLLLDKLGRRKCLVMGSFICCVSCVSFIFIVEALHWLKIAVYFLGKCGTAINITVIYVLTSEMFPTNLRTSLLSICSMTGRIGSMVAPQTPLLQLYWNDFPLTLFAVTSAIGGLMALLLPETTNMTLVDSFDEAKQINRKYNFFVTD